MDGNNLRFLNTETIPSSRLQNLQEVSLRHYRIQEVSEEAFSNFATLTRINLANNNLTKLPIDLLAGNDDLKILILSGNQISMLVAYQFPPLVTLRKIDLSNNVLRMIDSKAFLNLGSSMEVLDLRGNILRMVGRETFFPLHQLQVHLLQFILQCLGSFSFQHLFLMDNPWSCDCHLKDFRQFIIQRHLSPSPVTCYEPERLSGKTWTEVNSVDFACKPSVRITQKYLMVSERMNATIECLITGSPVPEVKWVLNGRIIANMSSSTHSRITDHKYVIEEAGTIKGRNDFSGSQIFKIPGL